VDGPFEVSGVKMRILKHYTILLYKNNLSDNNIDNNILFIYIIFIFFLIRIIFFLSKYQINNLQFDYFSIFSN
jgi:hypothetical protein